MRSRTRPRRKRGRKRRRLSFWPSKNSVFSNFDPPFSLSISHSISLFVSSMCGLKPCQPQHSFTKISTGKSRSRSCKRGIQSRISATIWQLTTKTCLTIWSRCVVRNQSSRIIRRLCTLPNSNLSSKLSCDRKEPPLCQWKSTSYSYRRTKRLAIVSKRPWLASLTIWRSK